MAEEFNLYQDIAGRTGGSIYRGLRRTGTDGKIHFYQEFYGADDSARNHGSQ